MSAPSRTGLPGEGKVFNARPWTPDIDPDYSADLPKRFNLVAFDDIKISKTPAHLVKGILPRIGLAVIYGAPKCGKSFLAFDLLGHVALGWKYRGRRVMGGPVVYCALEGAEGFKNRIEAFRQAHLQNHFDQVPFYLVSTPMSLIADHGVLAECIEATLKARPPVAIVIDTVNRSLAGSESDDRDMAAYIVAADSLKNRFNCLVLVVHHSGVDATRPRGHTSLAGAVDVQIAVKKDGIGNITATVELTKDFADGQQIVSRLVPVEIGTDDEGDPITSCVVEPVADAPANGAMQPNLSDNVRLAVSALLTVVLERGEPLPVEFGIPGNPKAIRAESWRDELFARGVLNRDSKNPRTDFARLKNKLCVKALAAQRDGLIWPL